MVLEYGYRRPWDTEYEVTSFELFKGTKMLSLEEDMFLIPTIDTESLYYQRGGKDRLVYLGENRHTNRKIMDIVDGFNGKATFYVSVSEWKFHGENKLAELCNLIKQRGNDVQLHTHPYWAYRDRKRLMCEYTLKEQIKIIEYEKNLIHRWIGEYPISHRAGSYGADMNTLKALRENGIFNDSSFFYSHKWCKLDDAIFTKNAITEFNGITEVPITVFKKRTAYKSFDKTFLRRQSIEKFDIDSCTLEELKLAYDGLFADGVKIVILFLHSHSLLKWGENPPNFKPDSSDTEKLEKILEYVTQKGARILSMKEFCEIYQRSPDDFKTESVFPEIWSERNFLTSVRRRFAANIYQWRRGRFYWPIFSGRPK